MNLKIWMLVGPIALGCATRKSNNSGLRGKVELTDDNAKIDRDKYVANSKVFEKEDDELRKQYLENPRLIGALLPGEQKKLKKMLGEDYLTYITGKKPLDCSFVYGESEEPGNRPGGQSPKFLCEVAATKKVVKIKYHTNDFTSGTCGSGSGTPAGTVSKNPEVFAETFTSRLVRLLGYRSDHYFNMDVNCANCPKVDPWTATKEFWDSKDAGGPGVRAESGPACFKAAITEVKFGDSVEIPLNEKTSPVALEQIGDRVGSRTELSGWSFNELVDPSKAKNQLVEKQAFTILAAMLGHVDNKRSNQRLSCIEKDKALCSPDSPENFAIIQDVGATVGGASFRAKVPLLGIKVGSDSIDAWAQFGSAGWYLWSNSERCTARFHADLNKATHGSSADVDDISTKVPVSREGIEALKSQFADMERLAKATGKYSSNLQVISALFKSANFDAWHTKEERNVENFWVPAFAIKIDQLNDKETVIAPKSFSLEKSIPKSGCR